MSLRALMWEEAGLRLRLLRKIDQNTKIFEDALKLTEAVWYGAI